MDNLTKELIDRVYTMGYEDLLLTYEGHKFLEKCSKLPIFDSLVGAKNALEVLATQVEMLETPILDKCE